MYTGKTSSLMVEVSILVLAGLLGYMFYDGLISVNQTLHFVGMR